MTYYQALKSAKTRDEIFHAFNKEVVRLKRRHNKELEEVNEKLERRLQDYFEGKKCE